MIKQAVSSNVHYSSMPMTTATASGQVAGTPYGVYPHPCNFRLSESPPIDMVTKVPTMNKNITGNTGDVPASIIPTSMYHN